MLKKFEKGKGVMVFFVCLFLVCIFSVHCLAAENKQFSAFVGGAHFNTSVAIGGMVSIIIKTFLSLLSVIFIVLILYAGFNWMTASGDEKKVEDAKTTIQRATIGLVIIIAAFSITYFVFSVLPYGSGGTTTGTSLGTAGGGSSLWDEISGTASYLWNFNKDNLN